jgi:PAT family beta-lactamase induction signal transducer AmpG
MDNAHPRVYEAGAAVERRDWRSYVPEGVRPYIESAPLAAACLGLSSAMALTMIAATLTTRLAQYGIQ